MLRVHFPIAERVDDAAGNRGGTFQVRQKPWDYYGCIFGGDMWACEVKRVKSTRFPLENFKEHQHEALFRLHKNLGNAWVAINWRVGGKRGTGVAVLLPYSIFKDACDAALERGCKHLKWTDFAERWQLIRITNGWKFHSEHPLVGCTGGL